MKKKLEHKREGETNNSTNSELPTKHHVYNITTGIPFCRLC
jgi:hypothetical protein